MQSDIAVRESSNLTITEMARSCGVSLRTLRFYEQIELIQPQRIGNQRLYSAKDKIRIELILTGKRLGFSLRDIGNMLQSPERKDRLEPTGLVETLDVKTVEQQISLLERQRDDIDAAITELKAVLIKPPHVDDV